MHVCPPEPHRGRFQLVCVGGGGGGGGVDYGGVFHDAIAHVRLDVVCSLVFFRVTGSLVECAMCRQAGARTRASLRL